MPTDRKKVFLDYTQTELDQAYDQLFWAPNRDAIQAEIRKDCEAVRKAMPPRTERYGKSEMQMLDEPALGADDVESLLVELMPDRNRDALRTGVGTEWVCDVADVGRVSCMSFRDHRGAGAISG